MGRWSVHKYNIFLCGSFEEYFLLSVYKKDKENQLLLYCLLVRYYAKYVTCAFVGAANLGPSFPPKWICKLGSKELPVVYAPDRTHCSFRMSCFLEKPCVCESKAKLDEWALMPAKVCSEGRAEAVK